VLRNGGLRSNGRRRSPPRLSLEDRGQIAVGIARGESSTAIARRLGRAPSTITRELKPNGGGTGSVACRADERALRRARRPKRAKLAACPRLRGLAGSRNNWRSGLQHTCPAPPPAGGGRAAQSRDGAVGLAGGSRVVRIERVR
jgi:hypothetical protein